MTGGVADCVADCSVLSAPVGCVGSRISCSNPECPAVIKRAAPHKPDSSKAHTNVNLGPQDFEKAKKYAVSSTSYTSEQLDMLPPGVRVHYPVEMFLRGGEFASKFPDSSLISVRLWLFSEFC
jgi:hypothetical protein